MKNNETLEMMLDRFSVTIKIRKLAIILVLAGIIICIVPLIPTIQNLIFSFVEAHISRKGEGGMFENRLRELLSLPFFGLTVFTLALCCLFSKTIAVFLEDIKKTKLIVIVTAGIGLLMIIFISIFSYINGWKWLNSDHSSEMVLGKLLAEENVFISRNWHYTTEIRLIHQTFFIMPLFKILDSTGNWALIRSINILLNNMALAFSFYFMMKQMKVQTKWILISGIFLLMPVSTGYWDIVTFGGYYVFIIIQLFCCLGLFIMLVNNNGKINKILPVFIIFTLLSFVLGVQGIRALLCVHIPLIITCVCLYTKKTQKYNFPLFLGCYAFVVCCFGFAINYLLHFWYSFHSFENMRLTDLYMEFFTKLSQSLVSFAGFFGLSTRSSILSARGLFSVIAILGTILMFMSVFKSLRQAKIQNNTMEEHAKYKFMPTFFIVSVIFNIFVFIIVDEDITERYFIPFMVLYIPLAAIIFEHAEKLFGHLKRITIILGIILFVFGQSYLNFQSMIRIDKNIARKGYIQYLSDNKLNYGFAEFWNANVTTELTNGKIIITGLNQFHINEWASPVKHSNPYFYQGESFMLLTRNEWELAKKKGQSFTLFQPDYEDDDFIIKRYPSAENIHREILNK
jgi:hypothetical protein